MYPNVSTLTSLPRTEQTALNRVFIWHIHILCSYLLNKGPAPTCKHCKCIWTVEQIVCTCTKYEHNRKQYFPNSRLSHLLLYSPKRNIFNYLTDINLLTKLLILFKAWYSLIVLKVPLNSNQSITFASFVGLSVGLARRDNFRYLQFHK